MREPAGAALPGIAPSNAYPCRDGYVLIAGNGDAIYVRLMTCIGRDDLGRDPDLAHNDGRARRVAEIDGAIGDWTARVPSTRCWPPCAKPTCHRAASIPWPTSPATRTTAPANHHHRAGRQRHRRGHAGRLSPSVRQPRRRAGTRATLGEHTDAVLASAGLSQEQRDALRARGVIE